MSILASDSFTRADASTLGANWSTPAADVALRLLSNACTYASGATLGPDSTACYTAISWPNDHYSQLKCTVSSAGSGQGIGPTARQSSTAQTRYRLVPSTAASNNFELSKEVAGTYTLIWDRTSAFTSGSVARLEAQGTTLRAFNAGAQIGASSTDSSIASGNAGIIYSASDATASGDDWEGGDFASPGYVPPPFPGIAPAILAV